MNRIVVRSIVLGALSLACGIAAQVPNEGMATKVVEARKANAALMKQYTWNCRTELTKEGKTLDIRIDQVQYGPDGKLQRVELNNQTPDAKQWHPRGFLRRAIADDKKKELEQYLTGLRALLEEYTLPTEGKLIDFINSAKMQSASAPDGSPLLMIQGTNVVKPGD